MMHWFFVYILFSIYITIFSIAFTEKLYNYIGNKLSAIPSIVIFAPSAAIFQNVPPLYKWHRTRQFNMQTNSDPSYRVWSGSSLFVKYSNAPDHFLPPSILNNAPFTMIIKKSNQKVTICKKIRNNSLDLLVNYRIPPAIIYYCQ